MTPVIPFLCLPVFVTSLYCNYKTPHPPPSYSWRSLSCLSLVSLILCLVVMTAPNYRDSPSTADQHAPVSVPYNCPCPRSCCLKCRCIDLQDCICLLSTPTATEEEEVKAPFNTRQKTQVHHEFRPSSSINARHGHNKDRLICMSQVERDRSHDRMI